MQLRPLFPLLGPALRHGSRLGAALTLAAIASVQAGAQQPAAGADVSVVVTGLRSEKGVVRACITAQAKGFPDCPEGSYSLVLPARDGMHMDFTGVAPGRYAIALVHDENENGRIDRALSMIPREGFGFSRDAPVRFGPPRYDDAAITVGSQPTLARIRMRYML